jgi:hypothetical protein
MARRDRVVKDRAIRAERETLTRDLELRRARKLIFQWGSKNWQSTNDDLPRGEKFAEHMGLY